MFGAYVLEACIQETPMGRIYRAEHQGLQRRVALKVLDAAGAAVIDPQDFIEHGRVASAVRHPAIVNVYDAGIHSGVPYIVTDLVEGVSLQALLAERGKLEEAAIVDIAVALASALAAVHAAGLVHDDLSPANVFLSEPGTDHVHARVVDVAHSKIWRAKRFSSGVSAIVSPLYMAPEVSLGGTESPLSDQYALGVIMYECATGTNPFRTNDPSATLRRISTGEAEPLSTVCPLLSKPLVALIERAMHLDPAARFLSMLELGHALSAVAGRRSRITWGLGAQAVGSERGDAAHPEHPGAAPSSRRTRRPRRRAARYAALAALTLGAGFALWRMDAGSGGPSEATGSTATAQPSREEAPAARPAPRPEADLVEPTRTLRASDLAAAPDEAPGAAAEPASAPAAEAPSEPVEAARPVTPPPAPPRATTAPARWASAAPSRARAPAARPKPAPKPAPEAPAPPPAPDWMPASESPAQAAQSTFERGTNEALILD